MNLYLLIIFPVTEVVEVRKIPSQRSRVISLRVRWIAWHFSPLL